MTSALSALHAVPPYVRRANVFPSRDHAALFAWTMANEAAFEPSRVTGGVIDSTSRNALNFKGDAPWKRPMAAHIATLVPGICADLGVPAFAVGDLEIEMVAYRHDGFIRRHRDTGIRHGRHNQDRTLSMVYYCHREPRGFTGGALRLMSAMPLPDGHSPYVDLDPEQNGLIAFPSWAPHEVLPVACPSDAFADARFAINFWARRHHAPASSDHGE